MAENSRQMPYYQDVDGLRIPGAFSADICRKALKYQPKEGDFFIVTFPKCGTNWVRQIVFLLYNKGKPAVHPMEFWSRMPFMEMEGVESVERMVKPGSIMVHFPFHLTPYSKHSRYLYVVRNPKDTLVSFYYHTRQLLYKFHDGSFDDYFEIFLNGQNDYGDYFDHVLGWYEHRNDSNVLFVFYEELKKNTSDGIQKIAKFMGKEYEELLEADDSVLANVLKYSSLEYMKTVFNIDLDGMSQKFVEMSDNENSPFSPGMKHAMKEYAKLKEECKLVQVPNMEFIRKGIVGDWRNMFSEDQNRRMDEKIKSKLSGTELYSYWKSIGCL